MLRRRGGAGRSLQRGNRYAIQPHHVRRVPERKDAVARNRHPGGQTGYRAGGVKAAWIGK